MQRLEEARRVAADLRLALHQAADASVRAVMADTDEASVAFASEAVQAKKALRASSQAIVPLLRGLGYDPEVRLHDDFVKRFEAYDELDRTVLALAVENTNLKAQRLSFGPLREEADTFRRALEGLSRAARPKQAGQIALLVSAAVLAVRDIQVLDAPHIAEADDAIMTRMEKQMDELEAAARSALARLSGLVEAGSRPGLDTATKALDRFSARHKELIALSRRNSNVRSLALSLGQERTLLTACDSSLLALVEALAKRGSTATR